MLNLEIVTPEKKILSESVDSVTVPTTSGEVVISIIAMMLFAGPIGAFVQRHPTVKMLALSFLLLIGVMLVAEGFHQKIPKGYIYFAMAFSVVVEILNLRLRKAKTAPVQLHNAYDNKEEAKAMENM